MIRSRSSEAAFSSIELLVVLTMIAILTYSGTQQYISTLGAFTRMTSINQFQSDIRRARIESITQGGRGIVELTSNGGYRMGIDYWPFDSGATIETQLFATTFSSEIEFEASGDMIFNSRGFLVDEGGLPTTVTFNFKFRGGEFCDGFVYSSGIVELSCR